MGRTPDPLRPETWIAAAQASIPQIGVASWLSRGAQQRNVSDWPDGSEHESRTRDNVTGVATAGKGTDLATLNWVAQIEEGKKWKTEEPRRSVDKQEQMRQGCQPVQSPSNRPDAVGSRRPTGRPQVQLCKSDCHRMWKSVPHCRQDVET